jgi:hypothetical protein
MNAANHRKAVADLRESIELHRVLGNTAEATGAAATLSSVYATLGRPLDALELVRATPRESLPMSGCTAYFFANNATFASLRAAERASVPWSRDPAARSAAITEAEGWLARLAREPDDRCSDRAARDLTRVHAAELAWLRGDPDALGRALRDHREAPAATLPVVEIDWRELELHDAVARRADADVARLAAALLDDAERFEQPHAAWAAHMARARALGGRDPKRARADLIAAERVLDRTLADVAVGDGRNAFLSAHEASAAALFDSFLQAGELEAAAAVVERSARRAIASATRAFTGSRERTPDETHALDAYLEVKVRAEEAASHDWELPTNGLREARERRARELADARRALEAAFAKGHPSAFDSGAERLDGAALRTPEDDDAMLYVHPSTTGYAAVLRTRRASRSARIEGPIGVGVGDRERAASRIARELLGPLPRGTRLHVVAYGPLRPLDWSKLAVDDAGTLLVEQVALIEHLGLGDADAASPATGAVVVADATLDLPYAAREGALVHERVGGALLAGSAATRSAVAGALESSTFVHYAGHGRFAGADGFESELLLANGSTLAVSDVLLLGRVPQLAVLSGCELSRSDDASGESFGVAQALLARGARFAIAPSRKVRDELAERFVHELYAGGALTEATVVDRMANALRKLARDVPADDWSTFRLLAR